MTDIFRKDYIVTAKTVEPTQEQYEEFLKASHKYELAAAGPVGANGKPRMTFINAWIAHEGRNLNGVAFVKEEMNQKVEEGLFSPPFAGMIDHDHDFIARGFWYKAAYAFDESAGKWGIFAAGAVWAWRFPELADEMAANMKEQGFIRVSMAAMTPTPETSISYPGAEGQRTVIMHNPIFFASTILSVPPGDMDAKGITVDSALALAASTNIPSRESINMDKELESLREALQQLADKVDANI